MATILRDSAEGARCWQCGRPADPACTYIKTLRTQNRRPLDSLGLEVRRGHFENVVRVPVPRCARCQERNMVTAMLCIATFFIGGAIGGLGFPSAGWTTILGAFGVLVPLWILLHQLDLRAGRQPLDRFPLIVRLRALGWVEPD